jgi:dipeptidyl aminopeptidase/acylaminoacyl peptidase
MPVPGDDARPRIAPFGSWPSPITADLIASRTIGFDQVQVSGAEIYWTEMRPAEAGRYVLVRRTADGAAEDLTPPPFNVRTRVHEYGGGAFVLPPGGGAAGPAGGAAGAARPPRRTVYFSNFDDQRLYRLDPGEAPAALTPPGPWRYADGVVDVRRGRLICVREDHSPAPREAINTLVAIDPARPSEGRVLVSGDDFYASPRPSPDGRRLAWLAWRHPNMPWDGTELWVAEIGEDGGLRRARRVAGGETESIVQPEWSPAGALHYVSDRSGWWNLFRATDAGPAPLCPMAAEFAGPQWLFAPSTYGFAADGGILCAYKTGGRSRLGRLDPAAPGLEPLSVPYTEIRSLRVAGRCAVFVGASEDRFPEIVRLDLGTGRCETLRASSQVALDPASLSAAQAVEFPTERGRTAHAFFYAPRNRDCAAPPGERPPLLVRSHGGPTDAATASLNLGIQYWTSRGFAVLDVNYGGSTGYGRAYRERLNGEWGVVDVDDCVNAARDAAAQGWADPERLAIRGSSAGGYTTLCALTFRALFKAGASHFGIGDLEVFVGDTHKFESRYLDRLIGPYPERRDLYRARSPIHFVDRISCPMILFQGLEDKIVPPNQAQLMVEALRRKGLPVAYLPFAGEQHGFRRAENIKRALEAELYFYARVFGFGLAEPIEPVAIDNLT